MSNATRGTVRGLAALEAVLLFIISAASFVLLTGHLEAGRDRLRQELGDRQLAVLREALAVYYLEQGDFPPGQRDRSSTDVWKNLRGVPACAAVLAAWPATCAAPPDAEPADPWRRPYRYLSLHNDATRQVADNGGWPIFLSAGPDGDFGEADPTAETDNRRTDELAPRELR